MSTETTKEGLICESSAVYIHGPLTLISLQPSESDIYLERPGTHGPAKATGVKCQAPELSVYHDARALVSAFLKSCPVPSKQISD